LVPHPASPPAPLVVLLDDELLGWPLLLAIPPPVPLWIEPPVPPEVVVPVWLVLVPVLPPTLAVMVPAFPPLQQISAPSVTSRRTNREVPCMV
jgi:hypothetical protein